ncbi:MerR family transcriptional regulator [Lachnoclostridium phytofermentans]|uniref:MerR family transcriptional regulator n=1 Tax=Lachnoclostridium phytofermentans TaxID=66219 RepID=UPI0004978226|nr:MerR family transcriptional regulator [Lachnoclostridium phytofermentans]
MSNNKDTLFTIGQFAALHEINKKTLMWYDEVGLFKPAVIKDNGYRYYTYHQSSTLETILMLRELNVSISEIQVFMENRSAKSLEILLTEKMEELDRTISRLKAIRKTLINQKKGISTLLKIDLSKISIIEKEQQSLIVMNTTKDMSLEKEIEMVIAESKKRQLHRLRDATYGSMISVDSLYQGKFDDYSNLFIKISNQTSREGLHLQPKGNYLRAFCQGSWDKLPQKYNEILAYANEHHLILCGYAYEMGINELTIDSMDQYITQIEIPIKNEENDGIFLL